MSTQSLRGTVGAGDAMRTPGLGRVLRDTRYVFWREMLLPLRDPFSLIFSLIQRWCSSACSARCSVLPWEPRPSAANPPCSGSCPAWW
nr:hypothetical protein [Arthrobacter nitrophenolicus]